MRLFHNLVLIKPEKPEEKKQGIYVTGNTLKELPPFGEVVAVSPGVTEIKPGDRVAYAVYAGVEVEDENVVVPFDSVYGVDDEATN